MSIPISIIMSAYNAEKYVSQSIESVQKQTFGNFEFLITDDCSTDHTLGIINSFDDERIVVFENKNRLGLTENLKRMVQHAHGRYIARIDADDICDNYRLEKQKRFLDNHNDVSMVCSFAKAIGQKEGIMKTIPDAKRLKASLLFGNTIIHSSVMFVNDGSNYDSSIKKAQDYELWDRFVSENKNIAVLPEPLVSFRYHSEQISAQNSMDQRTYSDIVRLRALKRIGIHLDDKEVSVFLSWINENYIADKESFLICEMVLKKIEQSGLAYRYYDIKALKNIVKTMRFKLIKSARKNCISIDNKIMYYSRSLTSDSIKMLITTAIDN